MKKEKKVNWYKNNATEVDYKSVLFVPVTKDGILVKEIRKCEEELNRNSKERIKVMESGGVKLKNLLVNKNPFKNTKCDEKKCLICK